MPFPEKLSEVNQKEGERAEWAGRRGRCWGEVHIHSEKAEACWCSTAYFKTPEWFTSSYKYSCLWLETQRELTSPFSSSAPGYVRKSPAVHSRVRGQNPIWFAFPQGPCSYATGKSELCKGLLSSPNLSIAGRLQLAPHQIHRLLSDCHQNTECLRLWIDCQV